MFDDDQGRKNDWTGIILTSIEEGKAQEEEEEGLLVFVGQKRKGKVFCQGQLALFL